MEEASRWGLPALSQTASEAVRRSSWRTWRSAMSHSSHWLHIFIFFFFFKQRAQFYTGSTVLPTQAGPHPQPGSPGPWLPVAVGLAAWQRSAGQQALRAPRAGRCGCVPQPAEVWRAPSAHSGSAGPGRTARAVCFHTTESRISEPRRTRGRGHTGDTSTKLSWMLSGLFSDSVKTRGAGELSDRAW